MSYHFYINGAVVLCLFVHMRGSAQRILEIYPSAISISVYIRKCVCCASSSTVLDFLQMAFIIDLKISLICRLHMYVFVCVSICVFLLLSFE